MRFYSLLALAASLAVVAWASAADEAGKGKLEGAWSVVSIERNGQKAPEDQVKSVQVTFTADKFSVKTGARTQAMTYKLDPAKKPATIDLTLQDGPDKGKAAFGIYSLQGDELKICIAKPGNERPTEFAAMADSEIALIVLKRGKP